MKRTDAIYQKLLERFGEPIGKALDAGEGVADERSGHGRKGLKQGNRGWGVKEAAMTDSGVCQGCGAMMSIDENVCDQCGMMSPSMDEGGPMNHKPKKGEMPGSMDEDDMDEMKLGVADRATGLPDRRDVDAYELEDLGGSMEPRMSIDVPRPDTRVKFDKRVRHIGATDEASMVQDEMPASMVEDDLDENSPIKDKRGGYKGKPEVDEVAPPGRERQVKALKKQKGVENPYAAAWGSYNKSHKK